MGRIEKRGETRKNAKRKRRRNGERERKRTLETIIDEIKSDKRARRHETKRKSAREGTGSPDGGSGSKKERTREDERGGSDTRRTSRPSERKVETPLETIGPRGGGR